MVSDNQETKNRAYAPSLDFGSSFKSGMKEHLQMKALRQQYQKKAKKPSPK